MTTIDQSPGPPVDVPKVLDQDQTCKAVDDLKLGEDYPFDS